MLLIDKYSPDCNDTMIQFHGDIIKILKTMSKDESIPHIIFYGNSGVGKKTLIKSFMEMLYDKSVNNTSKIPHTIIGSGNKSIEIIIKQSNYHIVIEPNNNNSDRYLVQDIIKEYAKKVMLRVFSKKRLFKTILINNIDNMSYFAQTSLRRTMEKYSSQSRFIMSCKSLSKVIEPLKSRCICIKVSPPTNKELFRFAVYVDAKEKINFPINEVQNLVKHADGNIKRMLWLIEMHKAGIKNTAFTYDLKIKEVAKLIITKNIKLLPEIRSILYNLMITNINCSKILADLSDSLCTFDIKNKYQIRDIAAKVEHTLCRSRREIISLDHFVLSVISVI